MIYPKTLCGRCNRKFDKLKAKNEPSNLDPYKFEAHRVLHCPICEYNVRQKRSIIAHLIHFDGVFGEIVFFKVSKNTCNFKRIYCIISKYLPLSIKNAFSILGDFSWSLSAKTKTVSCDNLNFKKEPDKLTDENVETFSDFLIVSFS